MTEEDMLLLMEMEGWSYRPERRVKDGHTHDLPEYICREDGATIFGRSIPELFAKFLQGQSPGQP